MKEKRLIEIALRESKDFSKSVRMYLYDIEKTRPLTTEEQELYKLTHDIHIKTNDAILILNKSLDNNNQ